MKKTRTIRLLALTLALILCLPTMASAAKVRSSDGLVKVYAAMDRASEVISQVVFSPDPYPAQELTYAGNGWYYYSSGYIPSEELIIEETNPGEQTPPPPTPVPTLAPTLPSGGTYPPAPSPTPSDISGQTDPEYDGVILRYTVPAGGLWLYNRIGGSAVVNLAANTIISLTGTSTSGWYSTYRNGTTYYVRERDMIIPDPTPLPTYPGGYPGMGDMPTPSPLPNPNVRSVVVTPENPDATHAILYSQIDMTTGQVSGATANKLSRGARVNVTPYSSVAYGYMIGTTPYYLLVSDTDSPSSASVVGGDQTQLMTKITIASEKTVNLHYTQSEHSAYTELEGPATLYGNKVDSTWYQVKHGDVLYYLLASELTADEVEQVADGNSVADGTFSLTIGTGGAGVYGSPLVGTDGQPSGTPVTTLPAGSIVLAGVYSSDWYTYVYNADGAIGYIWRGNLSDAIGAGNASSVKVFLDTSVDLYDKTSAQYPTSLELKPAYYVVKPLDATWYAIVYGGATYYIKKADIPGKLSIYLTAGMKTYDAKEGNALPGNVPTSGYYDAMNLGDNWYAVDLASTGQFTAYVDRDEQTATTRTSVTIPAGKSITLNAYTSQSNYGWTTYSVGAAHQVEGPLTLDLNSIPNEDWWGMNPTHDKADYYKTTNNGTAYVVLKSNLTEFTQVPDDITTPGDETPIGTTGTGKSYYIVIGTEVGRLYQDADCAVPAGLSLAPGEVVLATYYTSSLYKVGNYYLPVRYVASVRNGDDAAVVNPETPDDGIGDIIKGETDDKFSGEVFSYTVPAGGLWLYADAAASATPVLSLATGTSVEMTLYASGVYTLWYNGRQYYVKASALSVSKNEAAPGQSYSITLGAAVRLFSLNAMQQAGATPDGPTLPAGSRINVQVYANNMGNTGTGYGGVGGDPHIIYAYMHVDGNVYYFRDPASATNRDPLLDGDINLALVAGNTSAGLVTKLVFKQSDGIRLYTKPETGSSSISPAYAASTEAIGTTVQVGDMIATLYGVKYGSSGWYKVAYNGAAWYVQPATANLVGQIPVSGDNSASTYTVVVGASGAVYFSRPDDSYNQTNNPTAQPTYAFKAGDLAPGTTISATLYNGQWYAFARGGSTYYFRVTETANTSANDAVSSYRITITKENGVAVYNTISAGQNALGGLTLEKDKTYVLRKVNANWSSVMLDGKTYYVKNAELSQKDVDDSTPIGSTSLGKTYTLTVSSNVSVYNNSRLSGTPIATLAGGTQFTGLKAFVEDADKSKAPDRLVFQITYGNNLNGYIAAIDVGGVLRGDEADEAQNAGNGTGGTPESDVAVGTQVMLELRTGDTIYTSKSLSATSVVLEQSGYAQLTKEDANWYSLSFRNSTYYIPAATVANIRGGGSTGGGSTGGGSVMGETATYVVPYNTPYYGRAEDSLGSAGSVPKGITLTVQKVSDSWYQSTYSGQTIYLKAAYMELDLLDTSGVPTTPGTTPGASTDADGKILTPTIQVSISSGRLNMRREPGGTIVAYVPMNTVLPNNGGIKDGSGQYWYYTVFNGKTGYVSGAYVKPVASQGAGDSLGLNADNDMGRSLVINVESVNIRAGAGTGFAILGRMTKGQSVAPTSYEIGADGMYWYAFPYSGYLGYIRADFLEGSALSSGLTGNAAVRTGGTNMRTGAGETFSLVASLPRDKVVTITGNGSDSKTQLWYRVTVDGKSGYIRADMLRPLTVDEKNKLLEEAGQSYTQLKRGSKGAAVVALQQRLIQLGFLASGEADGVYGTKTEAAVRAFQISQGLTANGVASQALQVVLFGGTYAPSGNGTQKLEWFEGGMELIKQYPNVTVFDINSGRTWSAKYINGSSHADVVPASASDAKALVAYNITGSYVRRPVIVTIHGQDYAGSMYAVGHGTTNYVSYFSGVMCIHFSGSMTHGSDKVDKDHQNAIDEALKYGK
ncbi:MAG: SH3 domain-containing protein [Oscillospiraceae bacterium]|jgi:peptidoglycan hydrolase-like protein with peptidoglycan-binding domain|nr:SH3 domain-containing protein [Oscillospiraceae bacterium]